MALETDAQQMLGKQPKIGWVICWLLSLHAQMKGPVLSVVDDLRLHA
jgi:hypothetical protein